MRHIHRSEELHYIGSGVDHRAAACIAQDRGREASGESTNDVVNSGFCRSGSVIRRVTHGNDTPPVDRKSLQRYLVQVRVRLSPPCVGTAGNGLNQFEASDQFTIAAQLIGLAGRSKRQPASQFAQPREQRLDAGDGSDVRQKFVAIALALFVENLLLERDRLASRKQRVQHLAAVHAGEPVQLFDGKVQSEVGERFSPAFERLAHAIDERAFDVKDNDWRADPTILEIREIESCQARHQSDLC